MHQLDRIDHRPAVDFLKVENTVIKPDLVVRYENLESDVAHMLRILQVPSEFQLLQRRNRTAAHDDLRAKVLSSKALSRRVEEFYEEDMAYFDYAPFHP
ncbi:MAG: sulfotransferase family 2 domain-containing protein [Pseudomonadota bacterium]